jgi:uncharacterized protein YkwD
VSRRTSVFLTSLSVVLLIISIVIIPQFGVPVIFASGTPRQITVQPPTLTAAATQAESPTLAPTLAPATATTQAAQIADPDVAALIALINDQRKIVSSPALVYDERLSSAAQKSSAILAGGQQPSQAQIQGFVQEAGYYYTALWSTSMSLKNANAAAVFDAWRRDGQIQQSLLSTGYTAIGLSSTQDSSGTRHYIVLLAAPVILTAPGADVNSPGDASQEGQARAILSLLNAARTDAGLKPLTLNDQLIAAATAHSVDQANMDKMTHDGSDRSQPADRATKVGYAWGAVGENVLERWDIHAPAAFDQWWNSPPHHENMMNPVFTETGLAYAKSRTGKYYYTMVLGTPR